jgi:hypothetical protein
MTSRTYRRSTLAILALAAWITMAGGPAYAVRGPDDPGSLFRTPPTVDQPAVTVDWTQYALVAVVACLLGIAATFAVLTLLRRMHRPSVAHA